MQRISIITVNYNHLEGVKRTMESVLGQTYQELEYIVIDGGSTDGSREYIHEHASRLSYWVSEPDNGLYDAMNKGITKASGEYVLFLNSGDSFSAKDVLAEIFEKGEQIADLIIGRQYHIRNGRRSARRHIYKDEINERFLISNTLPHQATFIKRSLLQKVGGYDCDYRIVADWVFWNEAIVKHHASVECISTFVAEMEEEGLSSNMEACRMEMAQYLQRRNPSMSEEDWKTLIQENSESYLYRRTMRNKLSTFLVRLALRLNK